MGVCTSSFIRDAEDDRASNHRSSSLVTKEIESGPVPVCSFRGIGGVQRRMSTRSLIRLESVSAMNRPDRRQVEHSKDTGYERLHINDVEGIEPTQNEHGSGFEIARQSIPCRPTQSTMSVLGLPEGQEQLWYTAIQEPRQDLSYPTQNRASEQLPNQVRSEYEIGEVIVQEDVISISKYGEDSVAENPERYYQGIKHKRCLSDQATIRHVQSHVPSRLERVQTPSFPETANMKVSHLSRSDAYRQASSLSHLQSMQVEDNAGAYSLEPFSTTALPSSSPRKHQKSRSETDCGQSVEKDGSVLLPLRPKSGALSHHSKKLRRSSPPGLLEVQRHECGHDYRRNEFGQHSSESAMVHSAHASHSIHKDLDQLDAAFERERPRIDARSKIKPHKTVHYLQDPAEAEGKDPYHSLEYHQTLKAMSKCYPGDLLDSRSRGLDLAHQNPPEASREISGQATGAHAADTGHYALTSQTSGYEEDDDRPMEHLREIQLVLRRCEHELAAVLQELDSERRSHMAEEDVDETNMDMGDVGYVHWQRQCARISSRDAEALEGRKFTSTWARQNAQLWKLKKDEIRQRITEGLRKREISKVLGTIETASLAESDERQRDQKQDNEITRRLTKQVETVWKMTKTQIAGLRDRQNVLMGRARSHDSFARDPKVQQYVDQLEGFRETNTTVLAIAKSRLQRMKIADEDCVRSFYDEEKLLFRIRYDIGQVTREIEAIAEKRPQISADEDSLDLLDFSVSLDSMRRDDLQSPPESHVLDNPSFLYGEAPTLSTTSVPSSIHDAQSGIPGLKARQVLCGQALRSATYDPRSISPRNPLFTQRLASEGTGPNHTGRANRMQ